MATQIAFTSGSAIKGACVPGQRGTRIACLALSGSRRSTRSVRRQRGVFLQASADESGPKEVAPESSDTPASEDSNDDEPTMMGRFFGTYLQLGVWIVTLSYAAYVGIQKSSEDPSAVGLLLAPPGAAAFLIISFLLWRFVLNKDDFE